MAFEEFSSPFVLYVVPSFAFHYMVALRTMCISSVGEGLEKFVFCFLFSIFCFLFFCFLFSIFILFFYFLFLFFYFLFFVFFFVLLFYCFYCVDIQKIKKYRFYGCCFLMFLLNLGTFSCFFHRISNLYKLWEMYHFQLRGFMFDVNHCCNCENDEQA